MKKQTQTCGMAGHILEFFVAHNAKTARPLSKPGKLNKNATWERISLLKRIF